MKEQKMDYKKCCELLKPLYGKNNDYGLFREDLTDAEKSNLEKNLDGGACFHWKGVIPGNGYNFYTPNGKAFKHALATDTGGVVLKIWDGKAYEQLTEDQKKKILLTKEQKQRIVNYCKQLYQKGTPEETYVADSIMGVGLRHSAYVKYFNEDDNRKDDDGFPALDYNKDTTKKLLSEINAQNILGGGIVSGGIAGAVGASLSAATGIGVLGALLWTGGKMGYDYFNETKKANYTQKSGPTLLKQVQDELDGKTLQNQQEKTNTQSRQKEQEIAKINEERQKEERQKEQEEKQKKEEDQRKNEENQRKKEEEREKEKDSTKITDSLLKDINLSLKDTNQPATVKGKKGQVTTSPENLQNLNQNLNAIRQKITEETQNSANVPAAVDTSSLENDKSLQTAMAVKEQGSWWSRNWDILAIIGGALGALGLGAWLIKRQKDKTKKAKAEASTLANQVSSLNSKVSSLTEALNTQSNQPATNMGTNSNTGTNTSGGSTLENSGSSVSDSTVDKGRPTKIVIKGKTSAEME